MSRRRADIDSHTHSMDLETKGDPAVTVAVIASTHELKLLSVLPWNSSLTIGFVHKSG